MFKRKLTKVIVSLLRRIANVSRAGAKRLMRAMLRSLMAMSRRAKLPIAGFVLPTVTMVMLVVVLLTLAITLRSFDRAQNARNVRVNQAVLAAATPAIDRAKAKIQFMLREDPQRPTATPSDNEMYRIMSSYTTAKDSYTFGDETRLRVRYDLNPTAAGIQPFGAFTGTATPGTVPAGDTILEDNEAINTAWRYPVDTDNNGLFDSYTLYGIFFRSPDRAPASGKFTRARKPLEARTPPMTGKLGDPLCAAAAGTSSSLVGNSGWYKSEGRLKKSLFVYTVNLPITTPDPAKNEEKFKGTTSISALEYQQDQSRIPLSNNAIVYEDDLEISPGPPLSLNGRMLTNSNLLVTWVKTGGRLDLFQVSSPKSCFYEQENSKIIVGGNVINGWSGSTDSTTINPVGVHLFKKGATPDQTPTITTTNDSVNNTGLEVLYNNQAYTERLNLLVNAQVAKPTTSDPPSVIDATTVSDPIATRRRALEGYFKERLRKVPFAEVAPGVSAIGSYTIADVLAGSGDTLRAVDAAGWNLPTGWTATLGATSGPGTIAITANQPQATYPNPEEPPTQEDLLGDRLQVGNNLPAQRYDGTKFIGLEPSQEVDGSTKWDAGDTTKNRTRTPRVTQLADVGATDRNEFWELAAAQAPETAVDGIGGLRVITGAGVYERVNSFLPPPTWVNATGATKTASTDSYDDPATAAIEQYPVVWPDTMPMSPVAQTGSQVYNNTTGTWTTWTGVQPAQDPSWGPTIESTTTNNRYAKGDLRMRATVLYHYATNAYNPSTTPQDQTPIACVSSYYDPSTSSTARNFGTTLPDVSGDFLPGSTTTRAGTRDPLIGSNNGVVYDRPITARPGVSTLTATTGLLGGASPSELERQANYVFPNGRFANEPLRKALLKPLAERTLADLAAIDATLCSLEILKGKAPDPSVIAHGAIREVAFLNGREVKAIDRSDPDPTTPADETPNIDETFTLSSTLAAPAQLSGRYDLALEERQPLEIRVTQLDLGVLRQKTITQSNPNGPTPEYMLPDSGIIYASRDDALPDRSVRQETTPGSGVLDEPTSKTVSPTDSRLDPTRRPNGIMLINGTKLYRGATPTTTSVEDVVREKGLTLVSNLPVYIKGEFNKHTHTEFTDPSSTAFYDRTNLDPSFACRQGDPRLPTCTGDDWRPATVLADAISVLSPSFREGFRNEGDFDLRNNVGTAAIAPRRAQGFYNNNFVTNGLSSGAFKENGGDRVSGTGAILTDASYSGTTTGNGLNSSYFNNFVTPVQRRGNYPEYLMEVCPKLPVSACTDAEWFVDPATSLRASDPTVIGALYNATIHRAGTTVDPPDQAFQRFPRRVAFSRGTAAPYNLSAPVGDFEVKALGVNGTGNIAAFDSFDGSTVPRILPGNANALWYGTVVFGGVNPPIQFGNAKQLFFLNLVSAIDSSACFQLSDQCFTPPKITTNLNQQPLLVPVLQIHATDSVPLAATTSLPAASSAISENTRWEQQVPTPANPPLEFNLIFGAGDVPSRTIDSANGDFNGGVQNLPRFLESWGNGTIGMKILGAFIQLNRSAYATAPYGNFLASSLPRSAFFPTGAVYGSSPTPWFPSKYQADNNGGSAPYFSPPLRDWGFDVGLLSQPPDLFTQRFTTPPTQTKPAEFFREVSRNDEWVQTLLCAVSDDNNDTPMVIGNLRPTASFCTSKTGS